MKISSSVHLAGIKLDNPLMNGAYISSKSLEDIEVLSQSSSGAIVVGSISIKPRKLNDNQGYWRHKEKFYSLNSYGMPNGGLPYFKDKLPLMVKLAHEQNKALIANLIGFSAEEFVDLISLAEKSKVDMVELNFGCPNVWDKSGKQKEILSYHPPIVKEVLKKVASSKPQVTIGLKLSPMPPDILAEIVEVIVSSKIVKFVTATNSYPNALTSSGTKVKNEIVLAGLTGRTLKPISLGVVKQLRSLLPNEIDIIGCGGISSANDVIDYLSQGAKAVQIATALLEDGPSLFDKILFQT
jgi:dihydroorotate dehydrogenase